MARTEATIDRVMQGSRKGRLSGRGSGLLTHWSDGGSWVYADHNRNSLIFKKIDNGKIVSHERAWCYREGVDNCTKDGGGPPEPACRSRLQTHGISA